MRAIVTVGISASGKTTWVNDLIETEKGWRDINRDWIRFNVVKPGANWSNYKFNNANEKEVTRIQGQMIMESWAAGENIVISDTNLNPTTRQGLINRLRELGYTVDLKVFHVTYETALKRDRLRPNSVGHEVIYRQMDQWNTFNGRVTYVGDESLPKAIIVDVDGTIAQMSGRGPFEWHRVGEDLPRKLIIDMVKNYFAQGYEILIVSGRSDECKAETQEWLHHHRVPVQELHMRKEGDYRRDSAIKEEIFWTHLAHKYNIVAAIDDRPMMIRAWHELKIPNVIAVANPYLEF
jgi:predicted kinase